ncbi:group II truncated hemoglobin [Chitinimonas lacunae]|uniref:Group II truncated hemoglobin n=1 Tax=Chitinimonas lacunae TaxID=1963018 RepID=A0ABV8MLJ1_9NEIS
MNDFVQTTTPYQLLGGETAVRRLVECFYQIMDSDPVAAGVRALHREDLSEPRERLFMFLSGWLGGPQLFVERFGHPKLRARHLPFAIDERARDEWLYCMYKAMDELEVSGEIQLNQDMRDHLEQAFWRTADFMRNREG